MLAVAVLLTSCHPLTNPLDPNSVTYTGEQTISTRLEGPRVLPGVVSWESAAEHAPGQLLGLDIPDDGSFVEPRNPTDTPELWVIVTFESSITWEMLENALIVVREVDEFNNERTSTVWPDHVYPEQNQIALFVPGPITPRRVRVRIVDPNGETVSERVFGYLPGDYDGNGTVEGLIDRPNGPATYDGYLASDNDPNTIRSDMDADGVVEADPMGSMDDGNIVDGNNGNSLAPLDSPTAF
jgi:hypothetical protein